MTSDLSSLTLIICVSMCLWPVNIIICKMSGQSEFGRVEDDSLGFSFLLGQGVITLLPIYCPYCPLVYRAIALLFCPTWQFFSAGAGACTTSAGGSSDSGSESLTFPSARNLAQLNSMCCRTPDLLGKHSVHPSKGQWKGWRSPWLESCLNKGKQR